MTSESGIPVIWKPYVNENAQGVGREHVAGRPGRRSRVKAGRTRGKILAIFTAAVVALTFASCTGGGGSDSQSGASDGEPKQGGTLTVGILGAGTSEVIVPSLDSNADIVRSKALYDRLFDLDEDLELLPRLATKAESNEAGDVWTFTLRDGVTWHDGKPFSADDVVWTLQSWGDEDSLTHGAFNEIIDYEGVRATGPLTVEVPLVTPVAQFPELVAVLSVYAITPDGVSAEDLAKNPIGTGPFKFESFEPGRRSVFTANEDYWEDGGGPYVDKYVINTSFSDPNAQYNALLGGQIDIAGDLAPNYAKQEEDSGQINILQAESNATMYFYMDTTTAPFDDPRVRKAIRLVADRQALVDGALLGYGTPRHDLFGAGLEYYADDLTIDQDIEQAKDLLKEAGQEDLSVTLVTSQGAAAGSVEAATLLAQQAKAAGITLEIDTVPPANAYSAAAGYPYTFGPSAGQSLASLTSLWRLVVVQYNETRWPQDDLAELHAAVGETDPVKAEQLWHDFQQQQFEEGGWLLWGSPDNLDGVSKRVKGLTPSPAGPLGNYRLQDAWVE